MLDVPKLGLDLLNRIGDRIAQNAENSDEFEDATACIESLKALVNPRSEIKQGLMATAKNGTDYVARERDIVYSLMATETVRRMM